MYGICGSVGFNGKEVAIESVEKMTEVIKTRNAVLKKR